MRRNTRKWARRCARPRPTRRRGGQHAAALTACISFNKGRCRVGAISVDGLVDALQTWLPRAVILGGSFRDRLPGRPQSLEAGGDLRRAARRAYTNELLAEAQVRLGIVSQPIENRASGARRWPPGLVGSITNKRTTVLLAVAFDSAYQALGIDLERMGSAVPSANLVAPEGAPADGEVGVLLALAAKEALFKALPEAAQNVRHADLPLDWTADHTEYAARCPSVPGVAVQARRAGDWVLAVAVRKS